MSFCIQVFADRGFSSLSRLYVLLGLVVLAGCEDEELPAIDLYKESRSAAQAAEPSELQPSVPPKSPADAPGEQSGAKLARNWTKVTALDERVSLEMPGKPTIAKQTANSKFGPIQFVSHKVSENGVYWNLMIVTYPDAVVQANKEPLEFLNHLAAGNEKQKTGSRREYVREIEESEYWSIEHRFRYPSGRNSAGSYAAGFAIHRHYLTGNSDCWLFVDVADSIYQRQKAAVDADLKRFFDSFELADERAR